MKITVDRIAEDSTLKFIITVSDPHEAPFTDVDQQSLGFFTLCQKAIEEISHPGDDIRHQVHNAIHSVKERIFQKVKHDLTWSILNQLDEKITPMRTDIYNWIYDFQPERTKKWMQEFDPQRSKYYFDNDRPSDDEFED